MLFQVTMTVHIPADANPTEITGLKATEKARCQELMRDGRWRQIWRVVGQYKNVSIFDVADHDTLHDILTGLPLYPFMEIEVIPLCRHPSSIRENGS